MINKSKKYIWKFCNQKNHPLITLSALLCCFLIIALSPQNNKNINENISKNTYTNYQLHSSPINTSFKNNIKNSDDFESFNIAYQDDKNTYSPILKLEEFKDSNITQLTLQIMKRDTLEGLLEQQNIHKKYIYPALNALQKIYNPANIKPGTLIKVTLLKDPQTKIQSIEIPVDNLIKGITYTNGSFQAYSRYRQVYTQILRADGAIHYSLAQTGKKKKIPPSIINQMAHLFAYKIDFQRDIKDGNSFSVLYEIVRDTLDDKITKAKLLYASINAKGKTYSIYHFDDADEEGYYYPDGTSVRTPLLKTPLRSAKISSPYGMRKHPILGYNRMHRGVDFAAPHGTPILAAGDGRISFIGKNRSYGRYVKIAHSNGYTTLYAHMSKYAGNIRKNSFVKQGTIIGYVGNTGISTGNHLHYEVIYNKKKINPMKLVFSEGSKLSTRSVRVLEEQIKNLNGLYLSLVANSDLATK